MSEFIPTGRTSLIKANKVSLQIQTEYANRPFPRITTTILNAGQVVHKLERKLDNPILSLEEQDAANEMISRQHQEVLNTIEKKKNESIERKKAESGEIAIADESLDSSKPTEVVATSSDLSVEEQIANIPGFQFSFELDLKGNFINSDDEKEFKYKFKQYVNDLEYLFDVFILHPGDQRREQGVYEIERDHLYLISSGESMSLVSFKRVDVDTNYEKLLKEITAPVFA